MKEQRSKAVLDLDGVIADARHRLHLIQKEPKDWDLFYARVSFDPMLLTGRDLALSLAKRADIVYLTGRREDTREATLKWLEQHGLPSGELMMRPDGDHRKAAVLKLDALKDMQDVLIVIDDDPAVCDVLEEAGFRVIQATWARAEEE